MWLNIAIAILASIIVFILGFFAGKSYLECDLEAQKLETKFYQHWIETMQKEFDKYIIQKIHEEEG